MRRSSHRHRPWVPASRACRRVAACASASAPSRPRRSRDLAGASVVSAGMAKTPLHVQLGMTDDELAAVIDEIGREPTHLELAMYAVMWSEHCSYKSSRPHL